MLQGLSTAGTTVMRDDVWGGVTKLEAQLQRSSILDSQSYEAVELQWCNSLVV